MIFCHSQMCQWGSCLTLVIYDEGETRSSRYVDEMKDVFLCNLLFPSFEKGVKSLPYEREI
jgi:hypothetical protein